MISETKQPESLQPPDKIRFMFDKIAQTYDLLNHLLSFGMDIRWRKKAVSLLREKAGGTILDIAAGSGDFSLEIMMLQPRMVVATDFAKNMLSVFRKKLVRQGKEGLVSLAACDALALPFRSGTFDATVVAFGIRNFADRVASMREMVRVLKPGGISLILELSRPRGFPMSQLYSVYAGMILPLIGKLISRHNSAYRYLPESIAGFPEKDEFVHLMQRAGFNQIQVLPLSFGVSTIFTGRKATR